MNTTNFSFTYHPTIELRSFYGHQRASLPELIRLLQECTFLHINSVEIPALTDYKNVYWIVHKWRILINRYPMWREHLSVTTEIVDISKVGFVREYSIKNGDEILALGISHGAAIDPLTRELKTTSSKIWTHPSGKMDKSYRIPSMLKGEMEKSSIHNLQYRDIDGNGHLNNVSYIDYLFEGIEKENPGLVRSMDIQEIIIKYSNEIFYPGKLLIQHEIDESSIFFIMRNEKTNEICTSGKLILR